MVRSTKVSLARCLQLSSQEFDLLDVQHVSSDMNVVFALVSCLFFEVLFENRLLDEVV